jgi:(R)-2-hydroxyacyl-CoA dehydratese activating ATPase
VKDAPLAAIGVDAGSTTCKVVAVSSDGALAAWSLERSLPRIEDQTAALVDALLRDHQAAAPRIDVVATGYGRRLVRRAQRHVTEITCHARGVFEATGHGGTLLDVGGQDSKVIQIGPDGRVTDFAMNDKCAAGTGRFLESTSRRLGVEIERLGEVTLAAGDEATLSSTCTVFAESEIVSLLAHGVAVEPILKGLHRALVQRLVAMIHQVGLTPPLMLSGGVARNAAVARLLEEETGEAVVIPPHPQLLGAYGAALVGLESRATAATPAG